jgi:ribonuclease T2
VISGIFIPTSPDGSKSSCPSTGISYLPKYQTATATATSSGAIATATATPYSGKGYLQAYTSGTNTGCLISAGTWYTTGTCATYTATASGSGFTLTSSKGPCTILSDNSFNCASGNTAAVFTAVNGLLAYAGSSAFYAAAVAAGSVQQKVYTTSAAVGVTFQWGTIPA